MAASMRAYEALIQALKIRIAKLKGQKFGPSSEKIEREIDRLKLALEDLGVAMATAEAAATTEAPSERAGPRRRGKPRIAATPPRERVVLDPAERCPECGGALRPVGEDAAEILELVTARLKVIGTARLKKSWRRCERMVQTAAPTPDPAWHGRPRPARPHSRRQVRRSRAVVPPGRDLRPAGRRHPPLDADRCGQAIAVLRPLVERIKAEVMRADRLHADGTPVSVLDPKVRQTQGKARAVKEGRIWVYVRDDARGAARIRRPSPTISPPTARASTRRAILLSSRACCKPTPMAASPSSTRSHRGPSRGSARPPAGHAYDATSTTCGRRPARPSKDALERIGTLYDIEREITGQSAEGRRDVRQKRSRPHVPSLSDLV